MLAQVRLIERGDESDKRGHGGRRSTLRPIFIKYPSMHAVMGAADMQHSGPTIEQVSVRSLKPYPRNARVGSRYAVQRTL